MKRFGILLKKWDFRQASLIILNQMARLVDERPDLSPIGFFFEQYKMPSDPMFALMQHSEVWNFEGPVIATDLYTAATLVQCPRPHPKFFYVWDLEWMFIPHFQFKPLHDIYCNPNINIIVRSQQHADIFEQCWRKPNHIIRDFNYHDIIKCIEGI